MVIGQKMEAEIDVATMEGCGLLTWSSWLVQPAFLQSPGPEMVPHILVRVLPYQSIIKKIQTAESYRGTFSVGTLFFHMVLARV